MGRFKNWQGLCYMDTPLSELSLAFNQTYNRLCSLPDVKNLMIQFGLSYWWQTFVYNRIGGQRGLSLQSIQVKEYGNLLSSRYVKCHEQGSTNRHFCTLQFGFFTDDNYLYPSSSFTTSWGYIEKLVKSSRRKRNGYNKDRDFIFYFFLEILRSSESVVRFLTIESLSDTILKVLKTFTQSLECLKISHKSLKQIW